MNIEFDLTWPEPALNPNEKAHWRVLSKARARQKEEAYYMTKSFTLNSEFRSPERMAITFTFCPPCVRTRDDDNFIAAMKGARDGVAKALGVDDSCFVTQPAQWGEVCKPGKVVLTLEELDND